MLLSESITLTGKDVLAHLDRALEVPRIDRIAAQGDVLVLRVTVKPAVIPMPRCVVAVASEASSNTHTLHPNGRCYWQPHTATGVVDLVLGTLTVPDDSTALLSHQEHGNIEILPGTYEVRRQREFSGEWNFIHD